MQEGAVPEDYWETPVGLQAGALSVFPPLEGSLYPEDCGACHALQFKDWSGSFHGSSISPGLASQFDPMKNPAFAAACYPCHAPLSEQQEFLLTENGYEPNEAFDERLKKSGVGCGVCHVRGGRFFGPPPVASSPRAADAVKPHGGFTASGFFEASGFCAPCHQFQEGWRSLNGKPVENTYNEWKESQYPAKGITCQSCHMPGRRHFFRGIHDPGTVRSGVTIGAERTGPLSARLTVTNTGVGHYFPTYVTARVVVRGALIDSTGVEMKGSVKEEYIARTVSLDVSREMSDTRLPPMDSFIFDYSPGGSEDAAGIILEVWVEPDSFYNRFFRENLATGNYASKAIMQDALAITGRSAYRIFREELPYRETP